MNRKQLYEELKYLFNHGGEYDETARRVGIEASYFDYGEPEPDHYLVSDCRFDGDEGVCYLYANKHGYSASLESCEDVAEERRMAQDGLCILTKGDVYDLISMLEVVADKMEKKS